MPPKSGISAYLDVLGRKCRDRVTGMTGVAASVSFDLYGCVMVTLTPPATPDGKSEFGHWYDHKRLEVLDPTPVMELPEFAWPNTLVQPGMEHGPANVQPATAVRLPNRA